jgi:hypothetical protein
MYEYITGIVYHICYKLPNSTQVNSTLKINTKPTQYKII